MLGVLRQGGGSIGIRRWILLVLTIFILTVVVSQFLVFQFVPRVKASPAHTFDTKYQGARLNTNPYTFSYTCGAGTTLFVLSIVVGGSTDRTGGAPTYNGVTMTQADQNRKAATAPETVVELWYLLNPSTGSSYTCSIPNAGALFLSPVASSYKAASGYSSALRTANGGTGTSTNPTGPTLTGLASGDVIVAVVGSGANTWNPTGRTGTQLYDRDDGTYGNGAQYLIKTDSNDVAMSWTFGTSDDWAICEAAFKENNIPSNGAPSGTNWDDTDNCYAQRQWYQAVVVYTDLDGYADFTYVELYLQTGAPVTRAQFRYTEDTNTASIQAGATQWDFDTTASNFVRSGNTITATWKFMPHWDATEEIDLDFKLYCIDSGTASDTDTIDVNFDVVTNLLVSTIECTNTNNPDRININTATQIDVTVRYANDPSSSTPTTFYPPDAEFTSIAIHDSSHTLKGTDTAIVNGVGNIAITSETTVQSMNYHAYIDMADADYTDGDESPTETIISDTLQVQSYTVSDSRANINDNVNIDVLIWFDYDNTQCTTGTITINGYSASHQGSGIYRITRTSASVTSVTYNTVACSAESTYGITTVDQNSQSTTVIWDRIRIDTLNAVSSSIPVNTQGTWYVTATLEYDNHVLGSGDSFTLSGYAFTWVPSNSRFEHNRTESSPITITINSFTSGNEATYGITVGNINGQSQSIEWYAGFNLNLHVMDWDLTDAISSAIVYKDTDTQISSSLGWANWTLVSGTVQIKVKYFGFWVNGTFPVTMDSEKTIDVRCRLYDATITVQESIQSAYLVNANVTVFNSTSTYGNRIKTGITGNKGQVALTNLPNNTLTFTQYGKDDWSLVIGNTTQLVNSQGQSITLTSNQNSLNSSSLYSIPIGIVVGIVVPLKGHSITKCLKRKAKRGENK